MSANPSSLVFSGFETKPGVLMLPAGVVAGGGAGGSTTPGVLMFPANAGTLSTTARIIVAERDFRVRIGDSLSLQIPCFLVKIQLDTKIGRQLKNLFAAAYHNRVGNLLQGILQAIGKDGLT